MAATKDDQGWAVGHIPVDGYIVEPTPRPGRLPFRRLAPGQPNDPDRRRAAIAITGSFAASSPWKRGTMPRAEFARVWEIHRRNTRPPYRVLSVPVPPWKAARW